MADGFDGHGSTGRGGCLSDVDDRPVGDDEQGHHHGEREDDAHSDDDEPRLLLSRMRVVRVAAETAPAAAHPGPDEQARHECEAAEGNGHHHPEEVRDVGCRVTVRVERVLRAAATGEHGWDEQRSCRESPAPLRPRSCTQFGKRVPEPVRGKTVTAR